MGPTERDAASRSFDRRLQEEAERLRRAEAAVERALAELRTVRRRLEVLQREAGGGAGRPLYAVSRERPPAAPPTAPPPLRPYVHVDEPATPPPGSGGATRSDPPVVPEGPAPGAAAKPSTPPAPGGRGRPLNPPPLPPGLAERAERERRAREDAAAERPRLVLLAVGTLLVLAVAALAAWLAAGGPSLGGESGPAMTLGSEEGPGAPAGGGGEPPSPGPAETDEPAAAGDADRPAAAGAGAAAGVLADLPASPEDRAALYDSLWGARSPLFDPLLERLDAASDDRRVGNALEAWRSGDELGPLDSDRLHSALLQLVLRQEVDSDLSLDGQVLRNPCRGDSCSALLNLWEMAGDRFGMPPMPEDAPRNPDALARAERALLLAALREEVAGG